jgi:hypothetical protein
MLVDCPSPVPASPPAASEDEAQSLLDSPALPTCFSHHKHLASQLDFPSLVPCACCQCHIPTPPLSALIPAVIIQPLLPTPTLAHCSVVHNNAGGTWQRCWQRCGSGEDCRHEQGWKMGSITGHKQSIIKHPQCQGSSCPAQTLLLH